MTKNWKMTSEEIFSQGPVVPVLVIKDVEHAVPLAKALIAGGIRVLEVTLRTEAALTKAVLPLSLVSHQFRN